MSNAVEEAVGKEGKCGCGVGQERPRKVYKPAVDIFEREGEIVLMADMPGVDEKSVDITVEKNALTIYGKVQADEGLEGYKLVYSEYGVGDYRRAFRISDGIDRDGIKASVRQGVLTLVLPKAPAARPRKIEVSAE